MLADYARVQGVVDEVLGRPERPCVLEAGCGSSSNIKLIGRAHIVGIDISQGQLDRNDLIDEAILGDLQSYPLPEGRFDLIMCWDVLEHLSRPELALNNLCRATRDDGVLVLAFPNVLSVKGLVAKLTPYALHRLAYRYRYGELLGRPGFEPFPTYLRFFVRPSSIARVAGDHGLELDWVQPYESGMQRGFRERARVVGAPWRLLRLLVRAASLGFVDAETTDWIMVFRMPSRRNRDGAARHDDERRSHG